VLKVVVVLCAGGKTWQIFLNLTFCQRSKKIDELNFPSVYSVSIAFLSKNTDGKIEFIDLFVHLGKI